MVNVIIDFKSVVWTMFIVVVAILAVFISMWIAVKVQFSETQSISYTVNFIDFQQRPYIISSGLQNHMNGELFRKNVQSFATNSPNADADRIMSELLSKYDIDEYVVTGRKDSEKIIFSSNIARECGPKKEGYCAPDFYFTSMKRASIGSYVIEDPEGLCSYAEKCYKESILNEDGSLNKVPDGRIVRPVDPGAQEGINEIAQCGPQLAGVCASFCMQGRTEYITNTCQETNEGSTPVCCLPLWYSKETGRGEASRASIPVFFMNKMGEIEVVIR